MFIINPDPYSLPCYRVGPFSTCDLSINHCLPDSDLIDDFLDERFQGKDFIYTENGRRAIFAALGYYNLKQNDVVSILTTSGNFYISGCVTNEIEKFCQWSRQIVPETRIIFVNHEFGFPFPGLSELKKYNLPIIEDCAGSFFSDDRNHDIGTIGDFVIYSFPKMFPLQIGGLLVSNLRGAIPAQSQIDNLRLRHVKNVLSHHILSKEEIIRKRIFNYKFLKNSFESIGFSERFTLESGTIPGVFMFRTDNYQLDLPDLKKYYWAHGVQCSVFYGEDAFFIPVHQALTEQALDYFYEIMKSFSKNRLK
jgi:hypothetical protein